MSKEIKIPDIGGAANVEVIEILVKVGDKIKKDDSLVTLESDKASMEIPAPYDGTVEAIKIKVGDKVSEGDLIVTLEGSDDTSQKNVQAATKTTNKEEVVSKEISVPDIGGANDVEVIEILVAVGDVVNKDDSIITLESDKASMEIPSPYTGKVKKLSVAVGDKLSEGDPILTLDVTGEVKSEPAVSEKKIESEKVVPAKKAAQPVADTADVTSQSTGLVHASPAVRRLARELGVMLREVGGTGRKGRIQKEDLYHYVKQRLSGASTGLGTITAIPVIDFSKFGKTEIAPLHKIKRLTAQHVHRSWITVPHVTQFDEADITELEKFRGENKAEVEQQGFKLTPLVFIMKAVERCLQEFPTFNASLDPSGENLILKKYFHIGIAVDTPNGLVVPVIREVDQKGIFQLAKEVGEISVKAREKGLTPVDMQGSCFTISSLGGISGTAFTPIVNLPDVAILGVSKAKITPQYIDGEFKPRLMLPLSLSYDHRVIDGAQAARFTKMLGENLRDIRNILL